MAGNPEIDSRQSTAEREEPSVLPPAADQSAMPTAVDPEAEWDQCILAGLKRMDTDPEFCEAVRRRTT